MSAKTQMSSCKSLDGFHNQMADYPRRLTRLLVTGLVAWLLGTCLVTPALGQTITVLGTAHLTGLEPAPNAEQLAHTVAVLSGFEPTQVCVERMSGERIEVLMADPERNAMTLRPETASRPLATIIVPTGVEMQAMLERRPADARDDAKRLVARWDDLDTAQRLRLIGLQLAGYEFHSAVLNWSYLDDAERSEAIAKFGAHIAKRLDEALHSILEVYSLGVPLARKAGLHQLCSADSQEDETRGMQVARAYGGEALLESAEVRARIDPLLEHWRRRGSRRAVTRPLLRCSDFTTVLSSPRLIGACNGKRSGRWTTRPVPFSDD